MRRVLRALSGDDHGQDLIEYALLTGFISLVAVIAITQLGGGLNTVYGNIASVFSGCGGGSGGGFGRAAVSAAAVVLHRETNSRSSQVLLG